MKMHSPLKRSHWLLLPLILMIGACEPAGDDGMADDGMADGEMTNVDDTMDAGSAITALTDSYVRHYNLGHPEQVATLYVPDGVALLADGSVSTGREAIQAKNTAQLAEGSPQLAASVLQEKTFGDTAVVIGEYSVTASPEGADPIESRGHWMAVDVREADGWKIGGLISNYDRQMSEEFLQGAAPTAPPAPDASKVGALVTAYKTAWDAGDAAGVANLYAENAWAAFADLPAASGRGAIETVMGERVRGKISINTVRSMDLGGGYTIEGGSYEISGGEAGPVRGNYWILVGTNGVGERKIEWTVTNGRPVSVIPAAAAM
jgi:uncharacterized protein (TIGR02246 family)